MSQMMDLGIPDNRDLLEALGRPAIAYGNLEMVQSLKTLENMKPDEALREYRKKGNGEIRKRIERLITNRMGKNGKHKVGVQRVKEMLLNARCHSKRRNALIHRFWGKTVDGSWQTSGDESNWEGVPSLQDIDDLVSSIQKTTMELNAERFEGGLIARLSQQGNAEQAE